MHRLGLERFRGWLQVGSRLEDVSRVKTMIPRCPGVYEWGYEDPASGNKVVAFYLGKAMNLQVRFSRYASSGSRRLVFPKETKSKVANNKREAFRDLQIQGYQLVYRCDALQHS